MATAIVSDLHLGTATGADLARRPGTLERLLAAIADADRVVFLGDLVELRERPAATVLAEAAPTLRRIGDATAGRRVTIVPGNHDHRLVGPALERARLDGAPTLATAAAHPPLAGEIGGRVADLMPDSDVEVAYPGVWLRHDVYATHGHYLDAHMTVPRVECLVAGASARLASGVGAAGPVTVDDYESILAPIYALSFAIAQNASSRAAAHNARLSRRVWSAATATGGAPDRLRRLLIGRAAIPAAVAALNAAGLGPFGTDISAHELRRAGLRAMSEVVRRLGIDADHVVFGHTHRAGPLPGDGDAAEWRLPDGGSLVNCGSWVEEEALADGEGPANPYWPGRAVMVGESGPPRLVTVLDGVEPRPSGA